MVEKHNLYVQLATSQSVFNTSSNEANYPTKPSYDPCKKLVRVLSIIFTISLPTDDSSIFMVVRSARVMNAKWLPRQSTSLVSLPEWLQFQSTSLISLPVHCTMSRRMAPVPRSKNAADWAIAPACREKIHHQVRQNFYSQT